MPALAKLKYNFNNQIEQIKYPNSSNKNSIPNQIEITSNCYYTHPLLTTTPLEHTLKI